MRYTYLLIDLFSVLVPFLYSFHPKLKFTREWPSFFPAILVTAAFFISWDVYFTELKVWGFNPRYVTGVYVFNLPIEEILFFICIPYACVFTYFSLNLLIRNTISANAEELITLLLIIASIALAIIFRDLYYTVYAFALLAVLLLLARYVFKVAWLSRFYVSYLILLIPFFLVNGILTGTGLPEPIVWYNSNNMLNIRLLTIPVEDIFYGMDLILLNIILYSWLAEKMKMNDLERP